MAREKVYTERRTYSLGEEEVRMLAQLQSAKKAREHRPVSRDEIIRDAIREKAAREGIQ